MAKNENIRISFLGMKLECTNPSPMTIKILILVLIFFVVLVALQPVIHVIKMLSG